MPNFTDLQLALYERADANSLRDLLVENQCTGRQSAAASCPVAKYLQRGDDVDEVLVNDENILVVFKDNPTRYAPFIKTPQVIVDFVRRFDSGDFPELDQDRIEVLNEMFIGRNLRDKS